MIKLVKFGQKDFNRLIKWIKSPDELTLFAGISFKYPLTIDQLMEYISFDNRKIFNVLDLNTGNIIGHCGLIDIDAGNKTARICKMLIGDKDARGKGTGELMVKELIKIAFEKLGLEHLSLRVYEYNLNAVKCYSKCGFIISDKLDNDFEHKFGRNLIMTLGR